MQIIDHDAARAALPWPEAVKALRDGHRLPRAEAGDIFLGGGAATLLSRAAQARGLGFLVKSVTVLPDNPARGRPAVQGCVTLFDADTGAPAALIDCAAVTALKTAADSVLGAALLARPNPRRLLILGAGEVARNLLDAYPALFPSIERIEIWARRGEAAAALAARSPLAHAAKDLPAAAGAADIVASATMARDPVLKGAWIRPGTHVDLIGAYKADMREADDSLIAAGPLWTDSRESAAHIGEVTIPLASGALRADAIRGDLYDLVAAPPTRGAEEITLFKNAGGAHLDLMIARRIADRVAGRIPPTTA